MFFGLERLHLSIGCICKALGAGRSGYTKMNTIPLQCKSSLEARDTNVAGQREVR